MKWLEKVKDGLADGFLVVGYVAIRIRLALESALDALSRVLLSDSLLTDSFSKNSPTTITSSSTEASSVGYTNTLDSLSQKELESCTGITITKRGSHVVYYVPDATEQ